MNITDLVLKEKNILSMPLKDILPIAFTSEALVKVAKEKLKLVKKKELGLTQEQINASLKDGQRIGKIHLLAMSRMGELLPPPEEIKKMLGKKQTHISKNNMGGVKVLPEGIDSDTAFKAREIKRHPKEVIEVIKEAERNKDIPTKTAVLSRIKFNKLEKKLRNIKEEERKVKADKKDINVVLTGCTKNLSEINIVLSDILGNWGYCNSENRANFIKVSKKFFEIVKNKCSEETKKWKQIK